MEKEEERRRKGRGWEGGTKHEKSNQKLIQLHVTDLIKLY